MLRKCWWQGRSVTTPLVLWFLLPFIPSSGRSRIKPQTGACGAVCVCWGTLIKKVTSTTTTKKEELFSYPQWNGDLRAGREVLVSLCLEESAWRKTCDCPCNVIVIMAGQGIAVVQWKLQPFLFVVLCVVTAGGGASLCVDVPWLRMCLRWPCEVCG